VLDTEYFSQNKCKYRVRPASPNEVPGCDPEQALLVADLGQGATLRHPLPNDLSDYSNATEAELGALAASSPYALDRKSKKFVSFEDVRGRFAKRLKKKARKRAMEN